MNRLIGSSFSQPKAVAAARTKAATPASATSPYAKDGQLSDFDVVAFLAQLEPGTYKKIKPDNPAYYLVPVWSNAAIKGALRALPRFHEEIETLCRDIDEGKWEVISNRYMEITYPDKPELHGIRIKDMLLYAYAARRISRAEFNTAHTLLNAREQFQKDIQPEYRYMDGKEEKKTKILTRPEDVQLHKLYEEDGSLTDEGYSYINTITDNLAVVHRKGGIPKDYDAEEWFPRIEQSFLGLPKNLQRFLTIENTLTPQERNASSEGAFWQGQITAVTMPLAACPDSCEEGEEETAPNKKMYSPSAAMVLAFLNLLFPDEYVQPVVCLGTLGGRSLARLHLAGFHPVATRDDRIKSNLLYVHSWLTGAFYASMHDMLFHCFAASTYSLEQREVCCDIIPRAMDEAIAPEEKNYFIERMVDRLADLGFLQPRTDEPNGPSEFLQDAMLHVMEKHAEKQSKGTQYFDFMTKISQKIKNKVEKDLCKKMNWNSVDKFLGFRFKN